MGRQYPLSTTERRWHPVGVRRLAATAALLALFAATACAAATGSSRPTLHRAASTVTGTGFHARESVRVRVARPEGDVVRTVRTTTTGRFSAPLPAIDLCLESVTITARGATGDSARLKLPQRACPPGT